MSTFEENDRDYQAFLDWARKGNLPNIVHHVATLMSWRVDLFNPYAPIDPNLRGYAQRVGLAGVLHALADIEFENGTIRSCDSEC